jgi:hypothetical protein
MAVKVDPLGRAIRAIRAGWRQRQHGTNGRRLPGESAGSASDRRKPVRHRIRGEERAGWLQLALNQMN